MFYQVGYQWVLIQNIGNNQKPPFDSWTMKLIISQYEMDSSINEWHFQILQISQKTICVFFREKAEQTIWNRLQQLTAMKRKRLKTRTPMKIGILGEVLNHI